MSSVRRAFAARMPWNVSQSGLPLLPIAGCHLSRWQRQRRALQAGLHRVSFRSSFFFPFWVDSAGTLSAVQPAMQERVPARMRMPAGSEISSLTELLQCNTKSSNLHLKFVLPSRAHRLEEPDETTRPGRTVACVPRIAAMRWEDAGKRCIGQRDCAGRLRSSQRHRCFWRSTSANAVRLGLVEVDARGAIRPAVRSRLRSRQAHRYPPTDSSAGAWWLPDTGGGPTVTRQVACAPGSSDLPHDARASEPAPIRFDSSRTQSAKPADNAP